MSSGPYLAVYRALFDAFGPQRWWPAQTPFEVLVGAVLTQNTAWRNVERAIERLRAAGLLHGPALLAAQPEYLAELIRPAGYHRVKTRRLLALCAFLAAHDALTEPRRLRERGSLPALRRALLGVHGVGGETADAILVYGLELPSFVVMPTPGGSSSGSACCRAPPPTRRFKRNSTRTCRRTPRSSMNITR